MRTCFSHGVMYAGAARMRRLLVFVDQAAGILAALWLCRPLIHQNRTPGFILRAIGMTPLGARSAKKGHVDCVEEGVTRGSKLTHERGRWIVRRHMPPVERAPLDSAVVCDNRKSRRDGSFVVAWLAERRASMNAVAARPSRGSITSRARRFPSHRGFDEMEHLQAKSRERQRQAKCRASGKSEGGLKRMPGGIRSCHARCGRMDR